jgi:hypothetical protein
MVSLLLALQLLPTLKVFFPGSIILPPALINRQDKTLLEQVPYNRFANVTSTGDYAYTTSFTKADENVNYFNVDAFFTWDFKLGCRIILGYKNWLGDDEYLDPATNKTYFRNFSQLFNLSHANEFTLKFIYFLDYNQLRKK